MSDQVHGKFKLFVGPVGKDGALGTLGDQIVGFVKDARIAPKSIGVEYLESAKKLVLSLGYRDDETPYEIKLHTASLGALGTLESNDVARLEGAMAKATAGSAGILCHELFVTESGDCHMVIMSRV